jgi:NAD(P)H dehydrogenase (quinone)
MNFNPVMNLSQYEREVRLTQAQAPQDVKAEQEKIQKAEALVFIYPNWWSDCPAILKGWFDKVWSYGFAYQYINDIRECYVKPKNALVICTAGHTDEKLEEIGIAQSMRMIMINDRLKNQNFENVKMVF